MADVKHWLGQQADEVPATPDAGLVVLTVVVAAIPPVSLQLPLRLCSPRLLARPFSGLSAKELLVRDIRYP